MIRHNRNGIKKFISDTLIGSNAFTTKFNRLRHCAKIGDAFIKLIRVAIMA
jgi:hypothetical protein